MAFTLASLYPYTRGSFDEAIDTAAHYPAHCYIFIAHRHIAEGIKNASPLYWQFWVNTKQKIGVSWIMIEVRWCDGVAAKGKIIMIVVAVTLSSFFGLVRWWLYEFLVQRADSPIKYLNYIPWAASYRLTHTHNTWIKWVEHNLTQTKSHAKHDCYNWIFLLFDSMLFNGKIIQANKRNSSCLVRAQ